MLLAIGLSLIFGLMTVVNFAHGSLYMLGAYFGFFLFGFTKNFWLALVVAPLLVGTLGLLIERFLIRRLYGRSPDDPLLLTFGLSLDHRRGGADDLGQDRPHDRPAEGARRAPSTSASWTFPATGSSSSASPSLVLVALWLFLERTNVGLIIRAGSRDPLMVRALGIDLGADLAPRLRHRHRRWPASAGMLAGPMRGVYAEMGVTMVIESFVVVVVGGMGSLLGAVVAGLLIGEVVSLTTFFAPEARRDHGVRRHGGRAARAAERPLRRGRPPGVTGR